MPVWTLYRREESLGVNENLTPDLLVRSIVAVSTTSLFPKVWYWHTYRFLLVRSLNKKSKYIKG